jgi:hypothetical protein
MTHDCFSHEFLWAIRLLWDDRDFGGRGRDKDALTVKETIRVEGPEADGGAEADGEVGEVGEVGRVGGRRVQAGSATQRTTGSSIPRSLWAPRLVKWMGAPCVRQ